MLESKKGVFNTPVTRGIDLGIYRAFADWTDNFCKAARIDLKL